MTGAGREPALLQIAQLQGPGLLRSLVQAGDGKKRYNAWISPVAEALPDIPELRSALPDP